MQGRTPHAWGICQVLRNCLYCPRSPRTGERGRAASSSQAGTSGVVVPTSHAVELHSPGPFNPAASLSPKTVKKVLNLEFVEMAELRGDMWVEDPPAGEGGQVSRRGPPKPPVTDIKLWLECYARMASLLVTRFPKKGPELWAYMTTY